MNRCGIQPSDADFDLSKLNRKITKILGASCRDTRQNSRQSSPARSSQSSFHPRQTQRKQCSQKSRDSSLSPVRRSEIKRTHSLINLQDITSNTSMNSRRRDTALLHESSCESFGDSEDDNANVAITLAPLRFSSEDFSYEIHQQNSASKSKSCEQLHNAVRCLHSTLIEIHKSCTFAISDPKSKHGKHQTRTRITIPSYQEVNSLSKLVTVNSLLSEQLQKDVISLIATSKKDRNRLEELHNDNMILKQRLHNSLNVQRTLEGELKELSKEKKLLEEEMKNLTRRIAEYLPPHKSLTTPPLPPGLAQRRMNEQTSSSGKRESRRLEVFYQNLRSIDSVEQIDFNTDPALSAKECTAHRVGSTGFQIDGGAQHRGHHDENKQNSEDGENDTGESSKTIAELDMIKAYVWRKGTDFERLHGRLNRNLEEIQKLKETVGVIYQEKEEIVGDLERVVECYQEVEKERDNYASILKMILKEKNCPESRLFELLNGIRTHLNNSVANPLQTNSSEDQSNTTANKSSGTGAGFLESALHVIQEQNMTIREEMTKLQEALQKTTGQNMLLETKNEELMGKVQTKEKQLETIGQDMEKRERDAQDKYDQLDQLYRAVQAAKDELDKCLEEKEKDIAKLKDLLQTSEKSTNRQAKKTVELQKFNTRLVQEMEEMKHNMETLNQTVSMLKSNMKNQSGKWCERVKSAADDLQNSKEHCKWLQTQIDNLNAQLVDAQEKVKYHEKDKVSLSQKVLAAEEERKILDRKILEITSMMETDTIFRAALAERNEVLQSEINRLRQEKLTSKDESTSADDAKRLFKSNQGGRGETNGDKTLDDLSSIASSPGGNSTAFSPPMGGTIREATPLSRKYRHVTPTRRHYTDTTPRAAVRLQKTFSP